MLLATTTNILTQEVLHGCGKGRGMTMAWIRAKL